MITQRVWDSGSRLGLGFGMGMGKKYKFCDGNGIGVTCHKTHPVAKKI